ncbi:Zn-dependent protease with chaperone function [Chryseobacterium defluvii]|uniref:Zn-dependent protease with chaperone function n=1 Tax=Chryseobacterium defluvii TaxID=160396 RepID=A0A840KC98_9FLAO|nr:M48 family metallopeptidase [Chryseobacterium defluvii]MBB4805414.1 Zn-dependent protease with chaperone function [Chryseobacterium defluvii]
MNNLPKISSVYKSKLASAIVSVLIFFTLYFVLILISLLLIFLLGYGAVKILAFDINTFTIIAAIGLFSIGLFVFYFLIRFIFSNPHYDKSHLIEITRNHQPELFAVIDGIVLETNVQAPKKVFLSPDVNASVSYDSIFWSMFLPAKKNLTIGIGLINSTSVGELKTILAHEFGHFSQKSMKVGGYVNQAEKIIFETVYNNKNYEAFILEGSGYAAFKFFGLISIGFISVFQFILKSVSNFLFKNHASLQREMEYHADAISTYITNPKEQVSCLLRLELSQSALDNSLLFYTNSEQKYLPENLYENQSSLMKIISEKNNHSYENGLPKVDAEDIKRYNKTKIEIEDQWASHPDIDKRIEKIWKNNTKNCLENNDLAKNIVHGFDNICKILTNKYLTLYHIKNVGKVIDDKEFVSLYLEKYPYQTMNTHFNGYYERHHPVLENIDAIINTTDQHIKADGFFSDKNVSLVHEKIGIENDLNTLNYLIANPKVIKTFKYNGALYKTKDSENLIPELSQNLENVKAILAENDRQIFLYFYSNADTQNKTVLADKYRKFAIIDREYDEFHGSINEFIKHIQFMTTQLPFDQIRKYRAVLLNQEKPFKKKLNEFLEISSYKDLLTEQHQNVLKQFIDSEYIYFNNDHYIQKEVNAVFTLVNEYQTILNKIYLDFKEELLNFQAGLKKVP